MISYNCRAGIITGVGSSLADVIYALIGAMGITFITDFLMDYQKIICLSGGIIVVLIGIQLLLKKNKKNMIVDDKTKYIQIFVSSFTVAITNPTTILSFLFIFTIFDINENLNILSGLFLVTGIFIGTCCWWLILAFFIRKFRNKINDNIYVRLNHLFGMILTTLGVVIVFKNIIEK